MSWYDKLEEPIRPLVKLLRDNGINTTCSCGHEMYIEAEYYFSDLREIEDLLRRNGFKQFHIEAVLGVNQLGDRYCGVKIWIPKPDGRLSEFSLHVGSDPRSLRR